MEGNLRLMHALRSFIQTRMDARGWKPADLVRASGLSKQLVSQLLDDSRDTISSPPKASTVAGIARAFAVPESSVMVAVFEAMGYDLAEVRGHVDLSVVPSSRLLRALGERLGVSDEGQEQGNEPAPIDRDIFDLAARRGDTEPPHTSQED